MGDDAAALLSNIRRGFEWSAPSSPKNTRPMTAANDLVVRRALESGGVEFIDGNAGGSGVRLRERHR